MRRGVRGSFPSTFDLNLTPLLDVVLQLITFSMVLVYFGTKIEGEIHSIRLPVAAAALPNGNLGLDRIAVAVNRDGQLLVDGKTNTKKSPEKWWPEQAAKRREGRKILGAQVDELGTLVVIRADRDASYGQVRKTLAQAQAAGFSHFTLVVLHEEAR